MSTVGLIIGIPEIHFVNHQVVSTDRVCDSLQFNLISRIVTAEYRPEIG